MTKCIIWLCSQSVCYRNWIGMIKEMRRLGLLLPRDLIRLSPCPSFAFSPHAAAAASTSAAAFPKGETAMNVFDRKAKALHRDRSVIIRDDHQVFDYLKEEVGYRVYDRILDIKRHFNTVVDLSAGKGYIGRNFTKVNHRVGSDRLSTQLSHTR